VQRQIRKRKGEKASELNAGKENIKMGAVKRVW